MNLVQAVLPLGGEDVEVAGDGEVLVLVAGEDAPLEVDHEPMRKSAQRMGLFMSATSKSHVY